MMLVGKRAIKTAVAVFICLAIYFLLVLILKAFNVQTDDLTTNNQTFDGELFTGWRAAFKIATEAYTPFFACIATAYSMSTNKSKSLELAKTRIIASLIGGLFGALIVYLYISITKQSWSFEFISATGNMTGGYNEADFADTFIYTFIAPIILTALSTVIVIWICKLLNKKNSAFAAVLTLTAVMTSLGTNAIVYGFNRIFSTIIGVLVALGVNLFRLPHFHKNKDLLFCVGIEGLLKDDADKIKDFMNYKINQMYDDNINLALFTTRTPATFMYIFDDVKINQPVICMSGAALYDYQRLEYLDKVTIKNSVCHELDKFLRTKKITPFKNYIVNNCHLITCEQLDNDGEKKYADSVKNKPYCNFVLTNDVITNEEVVYYLFIETNATVEAIVEEIKNGPLNDELFIQVYDSNLKNEANVELKYVKMYSRDVLKLEVLKKYCKENNFKAVGAIASTLSYHLLENCDYVIENDKNLQGMNNVLETHYAYDKIFKKMEKMYYRKNLERCD